MGKAEMSTDAIRDMLLTARMQAALAHAVYRGESGVQELAGTTGGIYGWYETGSVCAAALFFHDHVHLSIGGSNDSYDWAINGNRDFRKLDLLHIHQGYFDASRWIADELLGKRFFEYLEGRKLYVGGHSAGGAIAEIVAMRCRHLAQPKQIYTFGSPKWCSRLSASLYSAFSWESYRFVMAGDPVPYLPLDGWRQLIGRPGFAHTSAGLEITDDGQVLSANGLTMMRRIACLARTAWSHGLIRSLVALGTIRDTIAKNHGIARYRAALDRATEVLW